MSSSIPTDVKGEVKVEEKSKTINTKKKIGAHIRLLKDFAGKVGTYGHVKDVEAVKKEILAFENELYVTAAQNATECKLPFGKHKGISIHELWLSKEKRGKQYLKWLANQTWCFDDIKPVILGLINTDFETEKNKTVMDEESKKRKVEQVNKTEEPPTKVQKTES